MSQVSCSVMHTKRHIPAGKDKTKFSVCVLALHSLLDLKQGKEIICSDTVATFGRAHTKIELILRVLKCQDILPDTNIWLTNTSNIQ